MREVVTAHIFFAVHILEYKNIFLLLREPVLHSCLRVFYQKLLIAVLFYANRPTYFISINILALYRYMTSLENVGIF